MPHRTALLLASFFTACTPSGTQTFVLPEGYTGPVVVIFNAPGAKPLVTGESDDWTFHLPGDGVLLTSTGGPPGGAYEMRFRYRDGDGRLTTIAYQSDDLSVRQAFAHSVGSEGRLNGIPEVPLTWTSFVVGVPAARPDWGVRRTQAEEQALQLARRTRDSH